MAHVESGFDKKAVSHKGAIGIFQVIPGTASEYGVTREELFDEDINIQVGLNYMRTQLKDFGSRNLALAAYNSGPKRVKNAGYKIPSIRETINYIKKVNLAIEKYK